MILKLKHISRPVFLMLATLILFAGCSKGDEEAKASSARLLAGTVNCETTTNKIITDGSSNLTFEAVILGADQQTDWCSFDTTTRPQQAQISGKVGTPIYLYLKRNLTPEDRTAQIRVTYSDNYTTTLSLTQTEFSVSADFDRAWAEQPLYKANGNYIYKTYYATFSKPLGYARNFSICYDKSLLVAHWVAYPLVKTYRGSSDRTNWGYDPNNQLPVIPENEQQYVVESYGTGLTRGHQIPSADRTANVEANLMTFYATNMMPQQYDFNSGKWLELENKVRANMVSDTIYVVTGTHFTGEFTRDRKGNRIGHPTSCWKVLLRTKSGTSKKRIQDCTADELIGIGFWLRNDKSNGPDNPAPLSTFVKSIAEIEAQTGFTFFHNLPEDAAAAVKAQKTPSAWGIQ